MEMPTTMQLSLDGKLKKTLAETEPEVNSISSYRLFVNDSNNHLRFLVDTGANISVLPATKRKMKPTKDILYAANGTNIKTYGEKTLELNLGLRRPLRCTFIVADVQKPILGADFLRHHNLLVDLRAGKLIDKKTELSVEGDVTHTTTPRILTINKLDPYHDLLQKYTEITSAMFSEPTNTAVEHHIITTGPPVYCKPRPLPPHKYEIAKKEFQIMTDQGICRPSNSPWASPLHLAMKKNGEYRPCGDYRKLNEITKPDRYPIPRLRDFTYNLAGKNIFSKIDLRKAYNQIRMNEEDIEKTAVITPFGLFEFPRMCFGLRNAGQTFQRHIDNILRGMNFVFPFVDDLLIASNTEEEHRRHLETLFSTLQKNKLRINVSKCVFGQQKLEFLGYMVSKDGIEPIEERVSAIMAYPEPKTIQELRRFLGIINFYRDNIHHAAHSQEKLYKYLHAAKKNDKTQIQLTKEEKEAFEECKNGIKNAVKLSHPSTISPISLMCDASNTCVGAVLQQNNGEQWKPLGFFSKKLNDAQRKYSTYDRELLAIYLAIRHFRKMFEGKEIVVYTDHKPLKFALSRQNSKTETPLRTRYLHYIGQFTSRIEHVVGEKNAVADALSRIEDITSPSPIDFEELSQRQQIDPSLKDVTKNQKLDFKYVNAPNSSKRILCETSTGIARPYLPEALRHIAYLAIHEMSHPGIRATRKLMTRRFFWPGMNTDVNNWTKSCISCQRVKVQRHTISPLEEYQNAERLSHVHVDIVGPLPISNGKRYCVTMIDRATKWPEAFPVSDISAETVSKVIYEGWITRFGCCSRLTSDQGKQFEANLFKNLMKRMGIEKSRTTAYHPQANGMIERWHRTLKAALTARLQNSNWTEELPTVLFGLRAAIKDNSNSASPSEALYGKAMRLPGEFHGETPPGNTTTHFEDTITKAMQRMQAAKRSNKHQAIFIHDELHTCSHVFIRNDAYRKPLTPTYDGPFKVLQRDGKVYTVQLDKRIARISIDRLKPAFLLHDEEAERHSSGIQAKKHYITRSGRSSKPPVRFAGEELCSSRRRHQYIHTARPPVGH